MIYVKGLSKSFGDNQVIKNIDMHITPGEKVVIIGPSGSGKSTFLRCLNLLEIPTGGTITFDGQEITAPGVDINKVRRHMGMVFQHFNLFNNLTVKDNITSSETGQSGRKSRCLSGTAFRWTEAAYCNRPFFGYEAAGHAVR